MNTQCGTFRRVSVMSVVVVGFLLSTVEARAQIQPWIGISKPTRFVVLSEFGDAAVLDQVTGLIWERVPKATPIPTSVANLWLSAQDACHSKAINNQMGWRLPKIEELSSLLDRSMRNPALPPGHPFQSVVTGWYWAATPFATSTALAYSVNMGTGQVVGYNPTQDFESFYWCVRGGAN